MVPILTSRRLIEARIDPDWQDNTKGIFADHANGRYTPEYYCKCPNCGDVHGRYKSFEEAFYKRLCPLCAQRSALDWQEQVMKSRKPEPGERPKNTFRLRVESIVRALLGQ